MNLFGFAGHVVHEEILAEGVGSGEVGLAAAKLGDFLHEVDQVVIAGKHKRVDQDSGALALIDFFEGLADDDFLARRGWPPHGHVGVRAGMNLPDLAKPPQARRRWSEVRSR